MDKKEIDKKWKEIEAALNESTKELYGSKGWKAGSAPLHKGAKVEAGKEGVESAAEEFEASKKMENAPANKNKEGAEEAAAEFEGEKKAAGVDGVDRKEGAAGGAEISAKAYGAKSFRDKVRSQFGLSLDDKLNKPNMGKEGLTESKKKSLNEITGLELGLGIAGGLAGGVGAIALGIWAWNKGKEVAQTVGNAIGVGLDKMAKNASAARNNAKLQAMMKRFDNDTTFIYLVKRLQEIPYVHKGDNGVSEKGRIEANKIRSKNVNALKQHIESRLDQEEKRWLNDIYNASKDRDLEEAATSPEELKKIRSAKDAELDAKDADYQRRLRQKEIDDRDNAEFKTPEGRKNLRVKWDAQRAEIEKKNKEYEAQKAHQNKLLGDVLKFIEEKLPKAMAEIRAAGEAASMYGEQVGFPQGFELTGDDAVDMPKVKQFIDKYWEMYDKRDRNPGGLGT